MHKTEFAPRSPSRATRLRPRRVPLFAAVAAAVLMAIGSPAAVLGWTNYTFSSADEAQMVTLINQARASAGLPSLGVVSALTDVARSRSKDMWDRNYFCHTIPPAGATIPRKADGSGDCAAFPSSAGTWSWPCVGRWGPPCR